MECVLIYNHIEALAILQQMLPAGTIDRELCSRGSAVHATHARFTAAEPCPPAAKACCGSTLAFEPAAGALVGASGAKAAERPASKPLSLLLLTPAFAATPPSAERGANAKLSLCGR